MNINLDLKNFDEYKSKFQQFRKVQNVQNVPLFESLQPNLKNINNHFIEVQFLIYSKLFILSF